MNTLEPNLLSYGLTSAAAAGPVGVLLMLAVVYFAKRDAKRDDREREDRVTLATAIAQNTAALTETRKAQEVAATEHRKVCDELVAVKAELVAVKAELSRRVP